MRTLRGALIGFGAVAECAHAPAYASKASPLEIVAVAEPCGARHAAIRARLPGARIYPDFQRLLAREALDFVDVCTPPSEHMNLSLAAFARGLHVLCEKPLAMSVLEARRMVSAAIRGQSVLFPVHTYLHAPILRAVRGLLSHDGVCEPAQRGPPLRARATAGPGEMTQATARRRRIAEALAAPATLP
jgi:predicted dehydrogenase